MDPTKTTEVTLATEPQSTEPVTLQQTQANLNSIQDTGEPKLAEAPALDPSEQTETTTTTPTPATPAITKPKHAVKQRSSNMPIAAMCIIAVCFLLLSSLAYFAYSEHK